MGQGSLCELWALASWLLEREAWTKQRSSERSPRSHLVVAGGSPLHCVALDCCSEKGGSRENNESVLSLFIGDCMIVFRWLCFCKK